MPAPRYQRVIDGVTVPLSWLRSLLTLEPPERRGIRDNFRVIVRNARGEWRTLRITSKDEAKRVRAGRRPKAGAPHRRFSVCRGPPCSRPRTGPAAAVGPGSASKAPAGADAPHMLTYLSAP